MIQITDSGIGIPEEKLPHIFERFYQADTAQGNNVGSGIGLHLTKEYVNLHNGKIKAESAPRKGSVFTVLIPVNLKQSADLPEKPETEQRQDIKSISATTRKTLLIVEDNTEFRQFLVEQLETEFNIIQASNGEEGEQAALKNAVNLIITDIMMPIVDGVELCKRIKNNIQTSHIPVILLTARASNEFIVSGYEAGADEYISKPFNFDILLLRIRKLIQQQEERKAQFKESIEIKPCIITITSLDEKLIQNALQSVEKNMNNTEYSVEELSNDVGLSSRSLFNKIQSITGDTPSNFIRSIRLKRAAQLLRDTDLNISEIADHVGFGNIKYFNRHFKEEFSTTPTQYRKDTAGNNH
jgi:YesN/AraC family two-component response regulator